MNVSKVRKKAINFTQKNKNPKGLNRGVVVVFSTGSLSKAASINNTEDFCSNDAGASLKLFIYLLLFFYLSPVKNVFTTLKYNQYNNYKNQQ